MPGGGPDPPERISSLVTGTRRESDSPVSGASPAQLDETSANADVPEPPKRWSSLHKSTSVGGLDGN